jgi:hypothetical protein
VHLGYGLALILAFIGVKLVLHWAHGVWPATPEVPTLASLAVILGILGTVTATSLVSTRRRGTRAERRERRQRRAAQDRPGAPATAPDGRRVTAAVAPTLVDVSARPRTPT